MSTPCLRAPLPQEAEEDAVIAELRELGIVSEESVCEICGLQQVRCDARAIARGRREARAAHERAREDLLIADVLGLNAPNEAITDALMWFLMFTPSRNLAKRETGGER